MALALSILELSCICTILLRRRWSFLGPTRAGVVGMPVEVGTLATGDRNAAEDPCRSSKPASRTEPAHITARVVNILIANTCLSQVQQDHIRDIAERGVAPVWALGSFAGLNLV